MKHWSQCRSLDTVEHSCPFSVCTTKLVNLSSSAYATGPPKTCPLFCAKASEASFAFLLLYNSAHVPVADELVIRFSVWSLEKKLVCLNLTPSISEGKQLSIHFAVLCLGPGRGGGSIKVIRRFKLSVRLEVLQLGFVVVVFFHTSAINCGLKVAINLTYSGNTTQITCDNYV